MDEEKRSIRLETTNITTAQVVPVLCKKTCLGNGHPVLDEQGDA